MSETWLRIDVFKPGSPNDQRSLDLMRKSIEECLNGMEREHQPGYKLGYWGRNTEEGSVSAVTYWDSHASIDGAAGVIATLQAQAHSQGMHEVDAKNVRLMAVPRG
jgi:hypothetical protein